MITIHNIDTTIITEVPITESCERVEELMKEDCVRLSWRDNAYIVLPAGAYVEHDGEVFYLLEPYKPKMVNEVEYQYAPEFQSKIIAWSKLPLFLYTDTSVEPDFSSTDNAANLMSIICRAIENQTGEKWTYAVDSSLSKYVSLTFSNVDIISGLNSIANAYETEWWADKTNKELHLSHASYGEAVTLEVGVNINVPNVTENNDGYYTRFYAFGSTRNIEQGYTGAAVNTNINRRLTLDPVKYPNGYKDIKADLQQSEVFAKTLFFDDIYPQADLTISNVRSRLMYRMDGNGEKVVAGYDEKGEPIYETYAIWYFQIEGFELNLDDRIEGLNLSAHFESGALNGREFELNYYEKPYTQTNIDGTPFQVLAGDYEINFIEENGVVIPMAVGLVPTDGNKIVLFNIKMPTEYTNTAYIMLEEALDKEIEKYSQDLNNYQFASNPVAFYENNPNLKVGHNVVYVNGDYSYDTRVIRIVKKLDYDCQQNITIGNKTIQGSITEIKEEVAESKTNLNLLQELSNLTTNTINSYNRTQQLLLDAFARYSRMWLFDDEGNIYSPFNVYSLQELTALGQGSGGQGGGGGVRYLSALEDVNVGTPNEGDVLTYNKETGLWEAKENQCKGEVESVAGHKGVVTVEQLEKALDLQSLSHSNLYYDEETKTIVITGEQKDVPVQTITMLSQLADVKFVSSSLVAGNALVYDGYHWVAGKAGLDEEKINAILANYLLKANFNKDNILKVLALTDVDIPNLSASKITSGTLNVDRIPDLSANKITSGVFDFNRLPKLYWANVEVSNEADDETTPTVKSITIGTITLSCEDGALKIDGNAFASGELTALGKDSGSGEGGGVRFLYALEDVEVNPSATSSGFALVWNGSKWVASKVGLDLDELASYLSQQKYITESVLDSWVNEKGYLVASDIANKVNNTIKVEGTGALEGGGDLKQSRTIDLKQEVKDNIGLGVTAHSWGNHANVGYFLASSFTKDNIKSKLGISDWALAKKLAFAALPTLYWANIQVSENSNTETTPTFKSIKIGDAILSWDSESGALHIDKNVYSDGELTAMGIGEGGSGTGGVKLLSALEDVNINVSLLQNGQVLLWNGTKWIAGTAGIDEAALTVYLQSYATQSWVEEKGYLTSHQSLLGYATELWVENKKYLTQHQDISGKQDKITETNKLPYSLISGTPTIPTTLPASDVYDWAKAETKPTYTKEEVGLSNVNNTADKDKIVAGSSYAGSLSSSGINDLNAPHWIESRITYDVFSRTANNKPVEFDNANGVLNVSFGKHSTTGNYGFQLAGADNYNLYFRGWSQGTPYPWRLMYHSGNVNRQDVDWSCKNLTAAGNISAGGEVTALSDMRLKDKVQNVSLRLDDIAETPLFLFNWKDHRDGQLHLGTSAQAIMKYAPSLVQGSEDTRYSLNYASLGVAMGVSIARELKAVKRENYSLRRENERLNEEIKELKEDIKSIKRMLQILTKEGGNV